MKFLIRLVLKFYKLMIFAAVLFSLFILWDEFSAGRVSFSQALLYVAAAVVFWRIAVSKPVMSILYRLCSLDPLEGSIARDRRAFNAWYDQRVTRQKEAQRRRDEESRARQAALNKAIWHENKAKEYAGSYDGEWHANMAKNYRNDAK